MKNQLHFVVARNEVDVSVFFRRGLADFNKCWASAEGCVILSDI